MVFTACKKDDPEIPGNPSVPSGNWAELKKLDFSTQLPHQVNIMFHVTDKNGVGIPGKTADDFRVTEDQQQVGSESVVTIKPTDEVDILVRTIILLDNSVSVLENLDQIKTSAIEMVRQKAEYQQMAIWTFSSQPAVIQDMTSDVNLLVDAINSIELGTSSTNLYGALVHAGNANIWANNYSIDSIRHGNLICMTDGNDTQGSVTLASALEALDGKTVYMLGLGKELDESIMEQFGDYFSAKEIDELQATFLEIQTQIENTANSYYWLYYQSPKRGNFNHELMLELKKNSNPNDSRFVKADFNSKDFTD